MALQEVECLDCEKLKQLCIMMMGNDRFQKRFNAIRGGPDNDWPFYKYPNMVILIIADELDIIDLNSKRYDDFHWIDGEYCRFLNKEE
ncbi:hypothetical protein HNP92_000283 [Methanococcus maripaludis]|uniref:Uncharacterized protein n=1 Tax=Methanococcus maripaludis TaxID=39152 RepID=A0A7J9S7N7_METMI|nr:hypothetical protein [Methanococcus maripaludis]MBB6400998.1 hypothetical protein [Methanococcus maripaludis]